MYVFECVMRNLINVYKNALLAYTIQCPYDGIESVPVSHDVAQIKDKVRGRK